MERVDPETDAHGAARPSPLWWAVWFAALVLAWSLTHSTKHFVGNLALTYFGSWVAVYALHPDRRRLIVQAFALSSASWGIAIALAEIPTALGILDYRIVFRTPISDPSRNPQYLPDAKLLFRRRPNQLIKGSYVGGDLSFLYDVPGSVEHQFDLEYDRNGFRNAEDLDAADVVVLGDSFVEANYVETDSVMTTRLARILDRPVMNLGLIGYGPQQQLETLRRYGLSPNPKVVVWVFFEGNDLSNVLAYDAAVGDYDRYVARGRSFVQRSFAKNSLQALTRMFGDPKPSALPRSSLVRSAPGHRAFFLYNGEPIDPEQERALQRLAEVWTEAHRVIKESGATMVVAFAPTKYRTYASLLRDQGSLVKTWTVSDLPQRLGSILSRIDSGIVFVDLTRQLTRAASSGPLPYFDDDSHWNERGNGVAADILAPEVIKLLPKATQQDLDTQKPDSPSGA